MNIPFVDFSEQYRLIRNEVDAGFKSVIERGAFILGQEEKDFEAAFAKYCGVKFAVGLNSGTDALFFALKALDIKPGDEVIIPTHTFIATALGASFAGATPVFVDVQADGYNLDPAQLEKAITKKTKAIIPVHLYGQQADMDEILAVAKKHGIAVVEDACQGHSALYKGRRSGSSGDVGCFSFYPTKGLGGFGDGGMLITNNEVLYQKVLMFRDYGRVGRYEHIMKGYNSRLDTLQAVVLNAKLKHLDEWNQMRVGNAAIYNDLLKDVKGIITPKIRPNRDHVYQTYAVRMKNRDQVMDGLKAKGIGALIHYPIPVHLQKAYAELGGKKGDFPVAEKIAEEILSLPMFPHMKKEQIEYVCAALKELVK